MGRRIRSIRPEFWDDQVVSQLSDRARLMYVGCWSLADDEGRLRLHLDFIRGALFWAHPGVTAVDVSACLAELAAGGLLLFYENSGQTYAQVKGWSKHQKVDKPNESILPSHTDPNSRPAALPFANVREPSCPESTGEEWRGGESRVAAGAATASSSPIATGVIIEPGVSETRPPREKDRQRTAPSTEAAQVAEYLRVAIIEAQPGHRATPRTAETWARDIDLAMRNDGRTSDELRETIDWVFRSPDQNGAWWRPNLQSGKKLRERFDQLAAQRARGPQQRAAGQNGNGKHRNQNGRDATELYQWALDLEAREKEKPS